MNRNGQINDMIFMISYGFMLAVFVLVMYLVWSETNAAIQASDAITTNAKNLFDDQATAYTGYMDYTFLTIMIAIVIGSLILSYFLRSQPFLFWALWIVVMVLAAVGGYIANAWEEFTSTGPLSVAAAQFSIMDYIMSHYLTFIIVMGMLMILVYFAKPAGDATTL